MAWTAPMTAVSGATFTAAQFNQFVRDNLNETAPAKATAAAQFFVSTAANAIAARQMSNQVVTTSESTSSTSYTDLTTVGPTVTATTSTLAMVLFASRIQNSLTNGAAEVSVAVSGASSVAASANWAIKMDGIASANNIRMGMAHVFTGLTAGSNTFTMKYLVGSGTGTFAARELIVLPF